MDDPAQEMVGNGMSAGIKSHGEVPWEKVNWGPGRGSENCLKKLMMPKVNPMVKVDDRRRSTH